MTRQRKERVVKILKQYHDRLELMSGMVHRTDALENTLADETMKRELRAMMNTCLMCKDTDTCKKWMAEPKTHATPPEFCPNAERLKALRAAS